MKTKTKTTKIEAVLQELTEAIGDFEEGELSQAEYDEMINNYNDGNHELGDTVLYSTTNDYYASSLSNYLAKNGYNLQPIEEIAAFLNDKFCTEYRESQWEYVYSYTPSEHGLVDATIKYFIDSDYLFMDSKNVLDYITDWNHDERKEINVEVPQQSIKRSLRLPSHYMQEGDAVYEFLNTYYFDKNSDIPLKIEDGSWIGENTQLKNEY